MCTKPFSAVPNFRFQNNFLFGINNTEWAFTKLSDACQQ